MTTTPVLLIKKRVCLSIYPPTHLFLHIQSTYIENYVMDVCVYTYMCNILTMILFCSHRNQTSVWGWGLKQLDILRSCHFLALWKGRARRQWWGVVCISVQVVREGTECHLSHWRKGGREQSVKWETGNKKSVNPQEEYGQWVGIHAGRGMQWSSERGMGCFVCCGCWHKVSTLFMLLPSSRTSMSLRWSSLQCGAASHWGRWTSSCNSG